MLSQNSTNTSRICPLVGIGALRPGGGMAFLLARLPGRTALPSDLRLTEIRNRTTIEAGHVYIALPDATLTIIDGRLGLREPPAGRYPVGAIDDLFGALALAQGDNAASPPHDECGALRSSREAASAPESRDKSRTSATSPLKSMRRHE